MTRLRAFWIPAFAGMTIFLLSFLLSACSLVQPPPQHTGAVPGDTITVNGNQNIYSIAQENGVSMRDIIILNNLHQPFTLTNGQTLILPFKGVGSTAAGGIPSGQAGQVVTAGNMQAAPLTSIQSEELAPPQPASSKGTSIGTSAMVPFGAPSAPLAPIAPPAPAVSSIAATSVAPQPQAAAAAEETATGAPPAMQWPVDGPHLSEFGPKSQGVSNDGVNIAAPKGAPVTAAANGIVVYAGNEMKGFGNLVLIRHENGWVTAYAHLDRTLVNKDAVVAKGDMIGTVGKTGNVSTPQLHFEVRQGGKAVDPAGVIKG